MFQSDLKKIFIFDDFNQAINFVVQIRDICENHNHHPDIKIFSYKKVEIKTTTHDCNSTITKKDHDLLDTINHFYESFKKRKS